MRKAEISCGIAFPTNQTAPDAAQHLAVVHGVTNAIHLQRSSSIVAAQTAVAEPLLHPTGNTLQTIHRRKGQMGPVA